MYFGESRRVGTCNNIQGHQNKKQEKWEKFTNKEVVEEMKRLDGDGPNDRVLVVRTLIPKQIKSNGKGTLKKDPTRRSRY